MVKHLDSWSLLELVEFEARVLLRILHDLRQCEARARNNAPALLKFPLPPNQIERDSELYSTTLDLVQSQAAKLGFKHVVPQVSSLKLLILTEPSSQDIGPRIAVLRETFENVLKQQMLLYIDPEKTKYWNQRTLFGDEVYAAFETARDDVQQAGNCFVTENYTACVFHLMRVAERGLRALAQHLNVALKHDVVLEEWKSIIDAIDRKLDELRSQFKDESREKEIRYYAQIATQFRYFKDGYRNHVAHARDPYDEHQALSILQRVEEFMKDLALRLSD